VDPFDEILTNRIGMTVGARWTLRRLLGTGGMAAVYAADDAAGTRVAIKLLHPEMGIRRDIRERFLREAAVMTRIIHPGMVTIYEQGADADTAYLAMELLEGEVLSARARREGTIESGEVLAIVDQILDVLTVAHSLGVIHRDLKPENLFLTRNGLVKVLDFGLARLLEEGPGALRTRTGAALGTLPYMAPEQALGRRNEVDQRTDLFAVGATAFRLIAGRRIHEAPSDAELLMCMASTPAPPLLSVAPSASPAVALVVDRALAFAKASRYPDAATMQSDVRAVRDGQKPDFATQQSSREQSATRVDRIAPRAQVESDNAAPVAPSRVAFQSNASAVSPVSQRGVAATVVMPTSLQKPQNAPQSANVSSPVAATLPHVDAARAAPQSPAVSPEEVAPRSLPATESMRAANVALAPRYTGVVAPTLPDPIASQPYPTVPQSAAHAPASSSPSGALDSHHQLTHARKKTLYVGLLLLFVLCGVTTTLLFVLFTSKHDAPSSLTTESNEGADHVAERSESIPVLPRASAVVSPTRR